jgi:putative inorganic carbon (HCO3(-)) transporter
MRRHLVRLFHALLIIVPFAFTAWNDELFEFNKMIAVYLFAVAIGVVWVWRMIAEKRVIFRQTILALPLGIFFFTQLLSTFFSINVNTSIFGYYSRFHGGLLSTITYIFLYFAAVSNLERKDVLPLIKSAILSAIGVSLYAIPEHFGVSPSCVLITKEFTAKCWVQDVQTRVFATFGQPNWLAAYFLMLMPLTIWVWIVEQKNRASSALQRWWPIGALFLMVLATYYTRSRSGFVALVSLVATLAIGFVIPFVFAKVPKAPKLKSAQKLSPILLLLIVFPLLIGAIAGTPYTPNAGEVSERVMRKVGLWKDPMVTPQASAETEGRGVSPTVTTTALENGGTDSGRIREIVWKGAFAVWKRYPLLGSGLETFAYSYYRDRLQEHNMVSEWDFLYNKAHNEYINTLATAGALGLGSLLLLLGAMAARLLQEWWKALKTNDVESAWLPIALGAGLISAVVTNFFGFSTVMVAVLTFLFPALLEIWSHGDNAPSKVETLIKATKSYVRRGRGEVELNLDTDWITGAFVGLVGAFLALNIMGMWNNDRILAQAKENISGGDPFTGYQKLDTLTKRAPQEPLFWNEKSLALAQIVAGSYKEDPSNAARLAQEVIRSSDNAVKLNTVHLNYWKSRARVFLLLSIMDQKYLVNALETLQKARELSPTDAKIVYNMALIYESMQKNEEAEEYYLAAIELRPVYEEARQSYAKFLEGLEDYPSAIEQYRYVIENLNPGDNDTKKHLEDLEASVSAQKSSKL